MSKTIIALPLAIFLMLIASISHAQVDLNATGGTPNASYTTLKGAFDAINAGTHTGTITIGISGNTTETASAVLNASGSGAASYASISISPTGGAGRSITGAIAGHLIDLNGADNITINGLNTGGNALTIENTTAGATSTAIRFIADASNNTLTNCTVKSASTSTTLGTLFFSTGATTGNDGNNISNNSITGSGASFSANAIYSAGSSAVIDNSGNTVSGNNISNYFSAASVTAGINLSATGNSTWTISNNKLFQTANRVYTTANTHSGILIGGGSGYTISGNTIGFANAGGTGTTNMIGLTTGALGGTFPSAFTNSGTPNATRYIAINCAFTAGGAVSNIQGNTMGGFALYTSSGASTTNGIWCGINVTSGNANIGTTSGNTIGAASGSGSVYTVCTTTGGTAVGIFCTSVNTISIQNNSIGAIDAVGSTASLTGSFTGIDVAGAGGVYNISNNTIGNTGTDNIRTGYTLSGGTLSNTGTLTSTTGAGATVFIRNTATGATQVITGNTFRGFASSSTAQPVTGITCSGAASSAVTINNNALGTAAPDWLRYAFANSGALTGISVTGIAAGATLTINGNDFRGITYAVASTGSHTYITWTHAASVTDNINNNSFTNLNINSTGPVTFLSRAGNLGATGAENVNGNAIVTAFNKGSAGGSITFFTATASSVNGASMNNNGNNFSNITVTGATSIAGWFNTDGVSTTSGPVKSVSNNTFSNIAGGSSSISLITIDRGAAVTCTDNSITNITGTGAITGISHGNNNGQDIHTYSYNTISNLVSSGTGGLVTGITGGSAGAPTINIINNSINTLSSTGSSATVVGLQLTGGATVNINGNTINSLSASGGSSPVVNGLMIASGTTVNIFKNKIYDLSQSGAISATSPAVNGMLFSGGTTVTAYNNLVGDLRATAASLNDAIRGISITVAGANTSFNLFYNTVYINASSSGANFGTTGIFHTASSTATTAALTLRNNIIFNTSAPAGTGLTVAYRRSSGAANELANYNAASNHNDFYTGAPGATRLIYSDGTGSAQSLTDYKTGIFTAGTITPRDLSSVSEDPEFQSTSGSSTEFLKFKVTAPKQMESGAVNITAIPNDYIETVRQGNTGYSGTGLAPDMGAWELQGMLMDGTAPVINYTPPGATYCTADRTLSPISITDISGVNTSAGTKPRLYFKKAGDANTFAGNTASDNGWKYVEATNAVSPFTFTTNYALLQSPVIAGDNIQYFIVAQDLASTPNVGINSGFFTAAPASVALTPAAFPVVGSINSYTISTGLSGTVTIGTGGNYTSLTGAGGLFAAINASALTGNLTAEIISASVTESGANALNAVNYGCSVPFTLTIKPAASVTATLSGPVNNGALLKLNGADNVIIDGSNNGSNSRNLSITNSGTSSPAAIWLASQGAGAGAANNTIKNCILSTGSNAASAYGIFAGGTSLGTAGNDNDNLLIQNNAISKAYYGIVASATSSGVNNNLSIIQNNIGSGVAGSEIQFYGIWVVQATGATISQNTITNILTPQTILPIGIYLSTGVTSTLVNANIISGVNASNTASLMSRGIKISTGTNGSNLTISNNSISDIRAGGWSFLSPGILSGIEIGNAGEITGGVNLYYNSVYLGHGNFAGGATATICAALSILSGVTDLNIRDNIFATNLVNTSSSLAKTYAIFSVNSISPFTSINNNVYYAGGSQGVLGFLGSDRITLGDIQSGTGQDLNSIAADPAYNSSNNLQPQTGSPVIAAGSPVAGITTDITGITRNATTPSMGAYEIAADITGPAISYTTLNNTLCLTDRNLSPVVITDPNGVNTLAGLKPRLYYKKSTDANTFSGNSSADNGWKYVEASNASSPFSFTTDYSRLQSPVSGGDVIQYFVVAQDQFGTPNVNINSGVFAATPSSVALTAGAFPIGGAINSYTVPAGGLSGTVTIGAAGTYTSLTGAGGLFSAMNTGGLSGNLSAEIIDASVTESGAIALNPVLYGCAAYTLTIKPAAGVNTTLSGTVNNGGILKLNGADNVIIDGSNNGSSSRNLTINNNSVTTAAAIWIASQGTGAGATNIIVKNCNISCGNSTFASYGIAVSGSTLTSGGADNDNVTIENNAISVATIGIAAIGTAAATIGALDNLTISGNTITNSTSVNTTIGIQLGNALNASISQNNIDVRSTTGNGPVGISLELGFLSSMITKNRIRASLNIYDYNGGRGITIATGSTASAVTISNNEIFGVSGNNYSFIQYSSMGICIGAIGNSDFLGQTAGGINLYYNSVNMYNSYTYASDGISTALYVGSGASALNIKNNVLVNTMYNTNPLGTGSKNYAIYSTATSAAFTSINYNDYFTAGSQGVLGYLASDRPTLASWQSATGQDANSMAADPVFNGPTILQPFFGSPLAGAGIPVAGITTDIAGITRNASTPTTGAYEILADATGPVITFTTPPLSTCTTDKTISPVVITDLTGVNTSPGAKPRLYFKKSTDANTYAGNTSADNGWKYVEATNSASPFSFTTNYALLQSAVAAPDIIQYFIVAEDLAATPNVGISSGTFAATPAGVALTAAAFPLTGTINSYVIQPGLSTSITIGAAGNYLSLTKAGGFFADLNNKGLTGNTTVTILDAAIAEDGANALNPVVYGCAGTNTLTIKPGPGVTTTLSGSKSNGALIKLNGADNIIFDGSNNGSSSRNMSINNTNLSSATVFWLASQGTDAGAANNTIKNCNISTGSNAATSYGIFAGGTSIGVAGDDNDNLIIQNNAITRAYYGIYAAATATGVNDNLAVTQNSIGAALTSNSVRLTGIYLKYCTGASVNFNTITNINNSTSGNPVGIDLSTGVTASTLNANSISGVISTYTFDKYGGCGIRVNTGEALSNLTISNNAISTIAGQSDDDVTGSPSAGIQIGNSAAATGGIRLYYNAVNLCSVTSSAFVNATLSAALLIARPEVSGLDVRDNIFATTQFSATNSGSRTYAIYAATAASAFTGINNNVYYAGGAQGVLGYLGSDKTSIGAWQAATGQDGASMPGDPFFTSSTNLQPLTGSPVAGAGTPVTGITTDITNAVRNAVTPSIGAYELMAADVSGPVITYTVLSNSLCTTDRTLPAVSVTDAAGVNTAGGTKPRLYFKKSTDANTYAGNTSADNGWKYVEAGNASSPFVFTTDYSLLQSPVAAGNVIQYFIVAQDLAGTPNVGINSGTFTTVPASVNLTAAAFPIGGGINQYSILSGGIGTDKTIGATGADYPSLTGAGGLFAAINAGGLTNNITVTLLDPAITETGANSLNAINYGCAGPYTLTIKPANGVSTVLSGNSTDAIIKLNGADFVTIDGSNNGTSSRDLTIRNTNNTSIRTAAVWIKSAGPGAGSVSNTIRNCNISCNIDYSVPNTTTRWSYGIIVNGTIDPSASTPSQDNDNIVIQNNLITKVAYGIFATGSDSYNPIENLSIVNNIIGPAVFGSDEIGISGIRVNFASTAVISGNEVRFVGGPYALYGTDNVAVSGIALIEGSSWNISSGGSRNSTVTNNKIHDIVNERNEDAVGIIIAAPSANVPTNNLVANNMVYNLHANKGDGIGIGISGGNGDNVVFNSVYMGGQADPAPSTVSLGGEAGISIMNNTVSNLTLKNNAIHMDVSSSDTSKRHYAIRLSAATFNWGSGGSDHNVFYINPANPQMKFGLAGTTDINNIAEWRTLFTPNQDAASSAINPGFIAAANLHIDPSIPSPVEGTAVAITGVTTDIDGNARSATPDIGADEGSFTGLSANDMSALQLSNPVHGANKQTGIAFPVQASFINTGTSTQTNVPVRYRVTGPLPATTEVYNQTGTISTLGGGQTAFVNFPNATLAAAGTYTIYAKAELPGDAVAANDEISGLLFAGTPLCGTYAVGASQPPGFQNLTQAIDKLNVLGISCPVVFELQADYSSAGEIFPLTINTVSGANAVNTFTLRPAAGVTADISGISRSAIIKFNNADYITIDGSNNGSGSRDLTISNNNTTTYAQESVIWLYGPQTGDGSSDNRILNCNIINGSNIGADYLEYHKFGIASCAFTYQAAIYGAPGNNNNAILNNKITNADYGIFVSGKVNQPNTGWNISSNIVGGTGTDNIRHGGILMYHQTDFTVTGNEVKNIGFSADDSYAASFGIALGYVDLTNIGSSTIIRNGIVSRNKIYNVGYNGFYGLTASGIIINNLSGSTGTNNLVAHNTVAGIKSGSGSGIGIGIRSGGDDKIVFNSVSLTGDLDPPGSLSPAARAAAILVGGPVPNLSILNNMIRADVSSDNAANKHFAILIPSGFSFGTGGMNFNNYYINSLNAQMVIGGTGTLTSNTSYATLSAWKAALNPAQDANSVSIPPVFTSSTDLHMNSVAGANCNLDGLGIPVSGITNDLDNQTRNAVFPDIGADEFETAPAGLAGTPGGPPVCRNVQLDAGGSVYKDAVCKAIVKVVPAGANPVNGFVMACVKIESAVIMFNSAPYLQRHVDIEPATAPSTATSRVTLYALQSEFNTYNANNGGFPDLPTGPADAAGIAALRVTQWHGTGNYPGNYTGSSLVINPANADIQWNAANGWWEISFDVTGFSGFYIHTVMPSPVPVTLLSFSGYRDGARNQLRWTTVTEINNRGFELQRSTDGVNYTAIGFIHSQAPGGNSSARLDYGFTDNNPPGNQQYYRLRQEDFGGQSHYSPVVLIRGEKPVMVSIDKLFPNPAHSVINIMIGAPSRDQLTVCITDMSGRILIRKPVTVETGSNTITADIGRLSSGAYLVKLVCSGAGMEGCEKAVSKFIKY